MEATYFLLPTVNGQWVGLNCRSIFETSPFEAGTTKEDEVVVFAEKKQWQDFQICLTLHS